MNAPAALLRLSSFTTLPTSLDVSAAPTDWERRIRQAVRRGQPIVLGTAAAPYLPSPSRATRSPLAILMETEGLQVSLLTASPLILRDLDLLTELDRRHAVTVSVTLPTLDPALAGRLEPGAPDPRARLHAVRHLAARGLETRIVLSPLRRRWNDRESLLRPLFAAAREAGAEDVDGDERQGWGGADEAGETAWRERLRLTLRRLRLEFGFPQGRPGRG